jgi:hypothetical protein
MKVMNWSLLGVRSKGADKTRLDSLVSYGRLLVIRESRILSCAVGKLAPWIENLPKNVILTFCKEEVELKIKAMDLKSMQFERYSTLVIYNVNTSMAIFTIKQPNP